MRTVSLHIKYIGTVVCHILSDPFFDLYNTPHTVIGMTASESARGHRLSF